MEAAVVGILAFGVGMMNDEPETASIACQCRPLQHLKVAVRIAECSNGAPADLLIDADGLAGLVVDEIDFE
jgi:hypothetical protein